MMTDTSPRAAKKIVVFDLKNSTEHTEIGRQISEMIRVLLPETKGFQVIDKGVIRSSLAETGVDLAEITDSGSGSEVARRFSAEYFIVGDIGRMGDIFTINIKLIDSQSSSIIKAEGLEFDSLIEIRKIIRGILDNILGQGKVSGKPVINEDQFSRIEKQQWISLSLAITSVIVQAVMFGLALSFPMNWDKHHLISSLALMIPPLTVLYTADWNLAPFTIGFSVSAGVFNFIGRLLWDLSGGDWVKILFGVLLVIVGAGAKLYSVVVDVLRSTVSVKKYNEQQRQRYFIS